MNEHIETNRQSWGALSRDHYETFRARLLANESTLSQTQIQELGDIRGKTLIHLQCNTGADTISLARLGATVTGVDLVPDNVRYARQLAADCRTIDQPAVRRMLSTYDRNSLVTDAEAWRIEDEVSRTWEGSGFDPAEIEKRRRGIMERGRTQI